MLRLSIFAFCAVAVVACADSAPETEDASTDAITSSALGAKTERALAERLPSTEAIDAWYAFSEELETALASGDPRFALVPHRGSGTSAYVEVKQDGRTVGAFLPTNSATVPLGEVRAYQLARALGVPQNVGAGVFFRLGGSGLASFASIMQREHYSGEKEANRQAIVAQLAHGGTSLLGVYKDWSGPRPIEYDLESGGSPNGTLDTNDRVARLLGASGPRPTGATLTISGGKAPDVDLAKELSSVLLIDALNGQWDRFSGGNMHVFVENGVTRFVTLDNGGITQSGTGAAATYRRRVLEWVKRYDRDVATKIVALDALAKGTASEACGLHSAQALRNAMMITTDGEWRGFTTALSDVAQSLQAASDASFL